MKIRTITFLLAVTLLPGIPLRAARSDQQLILTQAIIFSMPKAAAERFISQHKLATEPAEGIKDLEALVEKKEARSVANPSITTKNGFRAQLEEDTTKFDVECTALGDMIDTTLVFDFNGKKITTTFQLKNGDVLFLGALDSTGKDDDSTYLVFIRSRVSD